MSKAYCDDRVKDPAILFTLQDARYLLLSPVERYEIHHDLYKVPS